MLEASHYHVPQQSSSYTGRDARGIRKGPGTSPPPAGCARDPLTSHRPRASIRQPFTHRIHRSSPVKQYNNQPTVCTCDKIHGGAISAKTVSPLKPAPPGSNDNSTHLSTIKPPQSPLPPLQSLSAPQRRQAAPQTGGRLVGRQQRVQLVLVPDVGPYVLVLRRRASVRVAPGVW